MRQPPKSGPKPSLTHSSQSGPDSRPETSPKSGSKPSAKPAAAVRPLAAGDAAPAFELKAADGTATSLASLAGRQVVLYFYPKDDTPGCTQEAIDFNRLRPEFEKAGAVIIGVSPDSCASHAKFQNKHSLGLTLLSDEAKDMLNAYGVWTEKSMYGRKYMGVERTTFLIGKDGKILKVWNKVKVPGHAQAVLDALRD